MELGDRLPTEVLAAVPAILAAAEEGSATRVASRLNTTTSTVLRRIEAAEAALGVRLFDRLPTGLERTEALATLLPWAEQIAASCDGLRRDLAGLDERPHGYVRVSAAPTAASHVLVPQVPSLRAQYPGLTIEFDTATTFVNLGQREADIAIRGRKPADGDLVHRKVRDYRMAVVASPKLAAAHASNLEGLPWVSWERGQSDILETQWLSRTFPDAVVALRASELNTLLHAAKAGVGALLAPESIAAAEGGLVALPLEGPALPRGSLFLVTHRALRNVPRVAAVWEWLEAVLTGPAPAL